jgi:TolB protein
MTSSARNSSELHTTAKTPKWQKLARLAAIFTVGLGASVAPAPGSYGATFPGENGRIVYQDAESGAGIVTAKPDGTGMRSVKSGFNVGAPRVSPDGRRMAYLRFGNDCNCRFVRIIRWNGSHDRRLTGPLQGPIFSAEWSPNGEWISFVDNDVVKVVRADGTGMHRVSPREAESGWPTWAPGSRRLAYASDADGDFDVYTVRRSGRHRQNLTNDSGLFDAAPSWSPAGNQIAYSSLLDPVSSVVVVISTDGEGPVVISDEAVSTYFPTWSPDGSRLLVTFFATAESGWNVIESDGTIVRAIPGAGGAVWSPDSRFVFFDRLFDLFLIDLETGLESAVATSGEDEPSAQDWQARPIGE